MFLLPRRHAIHKLGAEHERVRVIDAGDLEVLVALERAYDPLVRFATCASELGGKL